MNFKEEIGFVSEKTINICLVFLVAGIPLIINPFAMDYWYKPKIGAVYVLLIIIIAITVFRKFVLKTAFPSIKSPLLLPLFFYGFSALISTLFSIDPEKSIFGDMWREEGVFALLSYCALPMVFASCCRSDDQVFKLIKSLLISSFVVALYGIVQYFGYNPTEHFIAEYRTPQIGSTIGNANFLGLFLVLVLPLFLVFYIAEKQFLIKIFYGFGIIVCISALMLTFTRASWLGLAVSLLVFGTVLFKKIGGLKSLRQFYFFLLLFSGIALILMLNTEWQTSKAFYNKSTNLFDMEKGKGSATRLFIWKKAIGVIKEKPLIGYGPDTHLEVMAPFNLEYFRTFRESGWIDRAHNKFLDIAIGQGLFGVLSYLSVMIVFMVLLWQALSREKDSRKRLVFCSIFASFCGYMVNGFFSFNVVSVSPTFWALMGIGLAMMRNNDKFVGTRINTDLTD